jgi:hypothetical protein
MFFNIDPVIGVFFTVLIFINMKQIIAFCVGCVAIVVLAYYAFYEIIFNGDTSGSSKNKN